LAQLSIEDCFKIYNILQHRLSGKEGLISVDRNIPHNVSKKRERENHNDVKV
jgi:hypothetical protein